MEPEQPVGDSVVSEIDVPDIDLWLDDVRPAPDGWTHVRSVNEAIEVMSNATVRHASLDHDLGDYADYGGDGYKLVDWMAEHDVWPTDSLTVHSANPVGVKRMLSTVDRYGPYPPGCSNRRVRR